MFKHDSKLGNAHAHELFERIQVQRRNGEAVPRSFGDYEVLAMGGGLGIGEEREAAPGVTLLRKA